MTPIDCNFQKYFPYFLVFNKSGYRISTWVFFPVLERGVLTGRREATSSTVCLHLETEEELHGVSLPFLHGVLKKSF